MKFWTAIGIGIGVVVGAAITICSYGTGSPLGVSAAIGVISAFSSIGGAAGGCGDGAAQHKADVSAKRAKEKAETEAGAVLGKPAVVTANGTVKA